MQKEKVIVIGGGIIGLSCAYYLQRNGLKVTVLDKDEFGNACSSGNQGWVLPAVHAPIPAPGLLTTSLKWMLKKDSPLFIKPTAMPKMSSWLLKFLKYCNEANFKEGEKQLVNLSRSTLALFEELEKEGLNFEMHNEGFLQVFMNETVFKSTVEKMEQKAKKYELDSPIPLTSTEVRELEPAISQEVIGGILLKGQRHVRPDSLSNAFIDYLKSTDSEMRPNTEVVGFEKEGNKIVGVKTNDGSIETNHVLLATGAWSGSLARKLGYTLPMQGGKGYSISISNPSVKFKHPIRLGLTRAGISPFENFVRIGGTMELSGINSNIDSRRIQGIKKSVASYLSTELRGDTEIEWAGMRPMTPDGLPVIGKIPSLENAYVATGHAMVGVALAPVTGRIISDLICFGNTNFNLNAFRPNRF